MEVTVVDAVAVAAADKVDLKKETKKVQTQLARRHENSFILRPSTSCSRPSSRGFNTSPGSSAIWSSRLSTMVQQPSADNSSAEKDVHIRKVRNRSMQRVLGNNRSTSICYEDKTSSLGIALSSSNPYSFSYFQLVP
uniref:Uncharacterized protein n=1 Tax=Leersia perrieri TaxID=77586 RepID=A0A0D9XAS1_9ORYZ